MTKYKPVVILKCIDGRMVRVIATRLMIREDEK